MQRRTQQYFLLIESTDYIQIIFVSQEDFSGWDHGSYFTQLRNQMTALTYYATPKQDLWDIFYTNARPILSEALKLDRHISSKRYLSRLLKSDTFFAQFESEKKLLDEHIDSAGSSKLIDYSVKLMDHTMQSTEVRIQMLEEGGIVKPTGSKRKNVQSNSQSRKRGTTNKKVRVDQITELDHEQEANYIFDHETFSESNTDSDAILSSTTRTKDSAHSGDEEDYAARSPVHTKSVQARLEEQSFNKLGIFSSPERAPKNDLLPNSELSSEDHEDEDIVEYTEIVYNPFYPKSAWSLPDGTAVTKQLRMGAENLLKSCTYGKMDKDARYATILSLSGIVDPSSNVQVKQVLNLPDNTYVCTHLSQHQKEADISSITLSKGQREFMKSIRVLVDLNNHVLASITLLEKAAELRRQEYADPINFRVGSANHDFKLYIEIFQYCFDFFLRDPTAFNRPRESKAPTEGEYVAFIREIFTRLFEGMGLQVRIGETGTSELAHEESGKSIRRKVDCVIERDGVPLSHSEFVRWATTATKKFWNDRSKILRLNQKIFNKLSRFGTTESVAFQFHELFGDLLTLEQIDDGLFAMDGSKTLEFPRGIDSIMKKLPTALEVLFYFRNAVKQKLSTAPEVDIYDDTPKPQAKFQYTAPDPAWTDRKAKKEQNDECSNRAEV